MRRDVCYFFQTDVKTLYQGYLTAANNEPFRRECREEPYHTLTFGLSFSMKYNFNGGSCTLHFIPYNGGAAIDLRFSIAQLAGARYEKYAQDLTDCAVRVMGVPGSRLQIPVDVFTQESNKVYAHPQPSVVASAPAAPAPVAAPAPAPTPVASPVPAPAPAPVAATAPVVSGITCNICGKALTAGDRFCSDCGTPVPPPAPAKRFCSQCGQQVEPNARFCSACGNRLQ